MGDRQALVGPCGHDGAGRCSSRVVLGAGRRSSRVMVGDGLHWSRVVGGTGHCGWRVLLVAGGGVLLVHCCVGIVPGHVRVVVLGCRHHRVVVGSWPGVVFRRRVVSVAAWSVAVVLRCLVIRRGHSPSVIGVSVR